MALDPGTQLAGPSDDPPLADVAHAPAATSPAEVTATILDAVAGIGAADLAA